jgi:cytosine/uracil/thiamine/allantoin permease
MSLMSTWTSSSSSVTSGIALSQVLACATIASGVLIVLLFLNEVWGDSLKADNAASLRVFYLPLIVTFCACVLFTAAHTL